MTPEQRALVEKLRDEARTTEMVAGQAFLDLGDCSDDAVAVKAKADADALTALLAAAEERERLAQAFMLLYTDIEDFAKLGALGSTALDLAWHRVGQFKALFDRTHAALVPSPAGPEGGVREMGESREAAQAALIEQMRDAVGLIEDMSDCIAGACPSVQKAIREEIEQLSRAVRLDKSAMDVAFSIASAKYYASMHIPGWD